MEQLSWYLAQAWIREAHPPWGAAPPAFKKHHDEQGGLKSLHKAASCSQIFFSSGGFCQNLCPYRHTSRGHWGSERQKSSAHFLVTVIKGYCPKLSDTSVSVMENYSSKQFKNRILVEDEALLKNLKRTSIIFLWLSCQQRWMQSTVTLQSWKLQTKTSRQHQIHWLLPTCFSFRLPFPSSQGQITACPKFQSIEGPHRKVPVSQTKAALCYSSPVTAVEFN